MRVLIAGEKGCGKTSLASAISSVVSGSEEKEKASPDIVFDELTISVDSKQNSIWNIGNVDAVIVVVDVTRIATINRSPLVKNLILADTKTTAGTPAFVLFANKLDALADVHDGFRVGAQCYRTSVAGNFDVWFVASAKNGTKVKETMQFLAKIRNEKPPKEMIRTSGMNTPAGSVSNIVSPTKKRDNIRNNESVRIDFKAVLDGVRGGTRVVKYDRYGGCQLRYIWMSKDYKRLKWGVKKRNASKQFKIKNIQAVVTGLQHMGSRLRTASMPQLSTFNRRELALSIVLNKCKRTRIDLVFPTAETLTLWTEFFAFSRGETPIRLDDGHASVSKGKIEKILGITLVSKGNDRAISARKINSLLGSLPRQDSVTSLLRRQSALTLYSSRSRLKRISVTNRIDREGSDSSPDRVSRNYRTVIRKETSTPEKPRKYMHARTLDF